MGASHKCQFLMRNWCLLPRSLSQSSAVGPGFILTVIAMFAITILAYLAVWNKHILRTQRGATEGNIKSALL